MARTVNTQSLNVANEPDALANELIAFAVAARLDCSGQSRNRISEAAGMDAALLSRALNGKGSFGAAALAHFDAVLGRPVAVGVGSGPPASVRRLAEYQQEVLTEFGLREPDETLPDLAAASYLYFELAEMSPRSNADVVLEAQTLLAVLAGSRRRGDTEADLPGGSLLMAQARGTLDRLLTVMVSPFGSTGASAHVVASLAAFLPQLTVDRIAAFIYGSPLGFQGVRALSMILARYPAGAPAHDSAWVLARALVENQPADPYPSRGYLVDALQHCVGAHAEAADLLERVALDGGFSKRPRSAAAYYLHRADPTRATKVLDTFEESGDGLLLFHATRLRNGSETALEGEARLLVEGVNEHISSCLRTADVPPAVKEATSVLLRESLTNVDVRYRRLFLNALMSGGIGAKVAPFFRAVCIDQDMSAWIRAEAAWCLGHLRDRESARELVALASRSPFSQPQPMIVRHHALWAVGEIQDPKTDTKSLAALCHGVDEPLVEVRRAALFALSAMRDPTSEPILERAKSDMDALCSSLARWGLDLLDARRDAELARALRPLSVRTDLVAPQHEAASRRTSPVGGLWDHE